MNDTVEKTPSCLAIVEKKSLKTGGCVGIFFHLFDWNRRLAKKKLLPKKLLPPIRLKQGSEINRDEKQAKLRLITDENCGGFPNIKKKNGPFSANIERKHEMRAPGLVARLMGLESMPSLHSERSKKVKLSRNGGNRSEEKFVDNACGCMGGEVNVEKGGSKYEFRPKKFQKTSFCETLPVVAFAAETLPFKNVLSRSKKCHPKLPSPVKSSRSFSKKNGSKLIGAAAKILEPGLNTSRSKSALTYLDTLCQHPRNEKVLERSVNLLSDDAEVSCLHCGHSTEQPSVFASSISNYMGCPCQGSWTSNLGQHIFCREAGGLLEDCTSTIPMNMDYERPYIWSKSNECSVCGRMCETQMYMPLSCGSNCNHRSPNEFQAKSSIFGRSNLKIPLNGLTTPIASNRKFESERRVMRWENDLDLHQGRKRRPNLPRQRESTGTIDFNKLSYGNHRAVSGRVMGSNFQQKNLRSSRRVSYGQVANNSDNPSLRPNIGSPIMKKRVHNDASQSLSGDALGAILEQKLQELTCQGEEDGSKAPQKTTAMILQELITALTPSAPFQHDKSTAPRTSTRLQESSMKVESLANQIRKSEHSSNFTSKTTSSSYELVSSIINNVSEILQFIKLANCGLEGSKLDHARNVLINTELIFNNSICSGFSKHRSFITKHLLVEELETLATILWSNFGCSLGAESSKEANQLRQFALDAIIEHLDAQFGDYPNFCSTKVSTNMLIFEIVERVGKWEGFSKLVFDELIEWEMGFSLRKWTRFRDERFEIAVEIGMDLLENLVEEFVMDF